VKRVILVTPRRDSVTCESVQSERQRMALLSDPTVAELPEELKVTALEAPHDVVRSRSLAVAHVLRTYPGAEGILWFDSDVVAPSLQTFGRLIDSGHDVCGCPVVRKKIERWGDEREACDFAYRVYGQDGQTESVKADVKNCIEVSALTFGLMWTSMTALRALVDHYRDELWFCEQGIEAVAIFALLITPQATAPDGSRFRQLLSEDFSFFERWRNIGGRSFMLLEPCAHVGSHVFRGHVKGLKYVR
jgi:hypothetical protein